MFLRNCVDKELRSIILTLIHTSMFPMGIMLFMRRIHIRHLFSDVFLEIQRSAPVHVYI